jgi:hypothetical protein
MSLNFFPLLQQPHPSMSSCPHCQDFDTLTAIVDQGQLLLELEEFKTELLNSPPGLRRACRSGFMTLPPVPLQE